MQIRKNPIGTQSQTGATKSPPGTLFRVREALGTSPAQAAGYGIFAGTLPQGQAHIKSRVCPRRNFLNKKENPRYIAWTTYRRGLLPLADDVVAVAVDHVVYINAGEPICHVRYHFLSSFVRS